MGILVPTDARPPRRRRHVVARATFLGVLAAGSLVGPGVTGAATTPAGPVGAPHPGTPKAAPTASASTSATAVARLHALADTIQASPADRQAGRFTYHHLRRWILDTTGFPAPRPNTPVVVGVEIHRWEADDGSGCGTDAELDPDYHLTAADAHYRSTEREFVRAPLVRATYPAGNVSSLLRQRGPLASDPALLARQLAVDPLPDGPQATLRAVEELYTTFTVPRVVRAASLHVLAGVAGIGYQHGAVDQLGRVGVAVSLDAGNLRYRLIVDPTTGQLLASEHRLIGPHDFLPVPVGLVTYYTLFVTQGRSPAMDESIGGANHSGQ